MLSQNPSFSIALMVFGGSLLLLVLGYCIAKLSRRRGIRAAQREIERPRRATHSTSERRAVLNEIIAGHPAIDERQRERLVENILAREQAFYEIVVRTALGRDKDMSSVRFSQDLLAAVAPWIHNDKQQNRAVATSTAAPPFELEHKRTLEQLLVEYERYVRPNISASSNDAKVLALDLTDEMKPVSSPDDLLAELQANVDEDDVVINDEINADKPMTADDLDYLMKRLEKEPSNGSG